MFNELLATVHPHPMMQPNSVHVPVQSRCQNSNLMLCMEDQHMRNRIVQCGPLVSPLLFEPENLRERNTEPNEQTFQSSHINNSKNQKREENLNFSLLITARMNKRVIHEG